MASPPSAGWIGANSPGKGGGGLHVHTHESVRGTERKEDYGGKSRNREFPQVIFTRLSPGLGSSPAR